jgi:hypothetical protein
MKKSNAARRRSVAWCSTPKCVHGAVYRMNTTGKLLCNHCKDLLDKAELTRLETTKEQP